MWAESVLSQSEDKKVLYKYQLIFNSSFLCWPLILRLYHFFLLLSVTPYIFSYSLYSVLLTQSLLLSHPVASLKVWNTKSLKDMPFPVKIYHHYPSGETPSLPL